MSCPYEPPGPGYVDCVGLRVYAKGRIRPQQLQIVQSGSTKGNWPTLATPTSAYPFAHKVLVSTPWSFHKTVSAVAALSALRPSRKSATIATTSSAPQSSPKASTSISRFAHKTAAATSSASSASARIKRRSRKAGQASRRTMHLNSQDA
ncbi:hypothetical protein ACLOJK_037416 [Asimina triloba]